MAAKPRRDLSRDDDETALNSKSRLLLSSKTIYIYIYVYEYMQSM